MASYYSKPKYWNEYLNSLPIKKQNSSSIEKNTKRLLLIVFSIASVILKQYLVLLFIVFLLLCYFLIIKKPELTGSDRTNLNWMSDNLIDFTINDDHILVKTNQNSLRISFKNISEITKFKSGYFFRHKSGFSSIIPEFSLSKEEIEFFEKHPKYQKTNGTIKTQ